MNAMSDKRLQLWCIYSVFVFAGLFLIGWVLLARFVPPPSPIDSPEEIAQFYRDNLVGIRVGMVLALFASALLLPWGGAICAQMLRIEGARAPLTWAWIAAQACVVIEFIYPCAFWLVAAFRPEDASRVRSEHRVARRRRPCRHPYQSSTRHRTMRPPVRGRAGSVRAG
jgi:hypothetical protein